MNTNHKHFYAAHSYMGLNYTYDSPCWSLFAFDVQKERDKWVKDNEYSQDAGNYVATAVNSETARKICPWLRKCNPHDNQTGYYTYNTGRPVNHIEKENK
jgi:hypothetical protein